MSTSKFPAWAPEEAVGFYSMSLECEPAAPGDSEMRRCASTCSQIALKLLTDVRAERIWSAVLERGIDPAEFLNFVAAWGAWTVTPFGSGPRDVWEAKTRAERREHCNLVIQLASDLASAIRGTPIGWHVDSGGAGRAVYALEEIRRVAESLVKDQSAFGRHDESYDQREFIIRLGLYLESRTPGATVAVVCDCVDILFPGERLEEAQVYAILREFKKRNSAKGRSLSRTVKPQ